MSTHEAIVVQIKEILPHPDPETIRLGIVKVWDYQCVVAKDSWKVGDLAVYIEPDNLVDGNKPEFSFLNGDKPPRKHRIKAKRLRGCWSEGLLVSAPIGLQEGDDAWTMLELERYVPSPGGRNRGGYTVDSEFGTGGGWEEAPIKLPFSKYDVENFKKFNRVLVDGEEVVVSCKLHGSNSKFHFSEKEGRMYCGSRAGWRAKPQLKSFTKDDGTTVEYQEKGNIWWEALNQNLWIERFCRFLGENYVVFGEVFGQVQDLRYGAKPNQIFFRMFDIWSAEKKDFLSFREICDKVKQFWPQLDVVPPGTSAMELMHVPILYVGPYSKEKVLELTDGQSLIPGADHIREGVVVKPTTERFEQKIGRVILKNVSNLYLERP